MDIKEYLRQEIQVRDDYQKLYELVSEDEQVKAELAANKARVAAARAEYEELLRDNAALATQMAEDEQQYAATRAEMARMLALAKDRDTTEAAAHLAEVQAQVNALVAEMQAAVPVLEARVAELSAGIATLEDRNARLQAAISAAVVIKSE